MSISEKLREYNRWRRGDETVPMPNPKELGALLDAAASRLDAIEVASQAVIDRWETPLWKDVPATANYIYALRDALNKNKG